MFIGAINAFSGEAGKGKNVLTGEVKDFSAVARDYKVQRIGWVAIGDENYGRRLVARTRRNGTAFSRRTRYYREKLCSDPRNESEETGNACAHVQECIGLRSDPGR